MYRMMMALLLLFVGGLMPMAQANDPANPTGTWKWTVQAGDRSREMSLRLKMEGGKLTGAMIGRDGRETPIEDATYADGKLSFKVTRERNGQTMTTEYTGKLSGDTITGEMAVERNGHKRTQNWKAERSKESRE